MISLKEKQIYKLFKGVLFLKIFNGAWQLILAWIILFDRALFMRLSWLVRGELLERPNNIVASYIEHLIRNVNPYTAIYIGFYFLAQAVLKILLVVGILKRQLWAYPTAIYSFLFLTFYQLYRFNLHRSYSSFLVILSALDVITIILIHHEYKRLKQHLSFEGN